MKARVVLVIPVPGKDRNGRVVTARRRRPVVNALLLKLGAWFGSATLLPSWGSWKEAPDAPVSLDKGQAVVLVATDATSYRKRRPALERLLRRAGRALDQEQMAAIAFQPAKGSLLIRC